MSTSDDDEDEERLTWWKSIKRSVRSVLFGLSLFAAGGGTLLLSESAAIRQSIRRGEGAVQSAGVDGASGEMAADDAGSALTAWKWRGVAFACTAAGLWMVFRPIATASTSMPLLGPIVRDGGLVVATIVTAVAATTAVIALCWIDHRPPFGILLLTASLASLYWLKSHADLRRTRGREPHGTAKLKMLESVIPDPA